MVHNKKFIDKFDEAIKILQKDKFALATFNLTAMQVYKVFAKQNNIDLKEFMNKCADAFIASQKHDQS